MALHIAQRGLDLPIRGHPAQRVVDGPPIASVALLADDYPGLKPQLLVREGDLVLRGQPLVRDRAVEGVVHTSPAHGRVTAIHRGQRRVLQSIVVALSDGELANDMDAAGHQVFATFARRDPSTLDRSAVRALMLESGMWSAFRTRPFGKTPRPDASPSAIFVTAIDTNPLAADPEAVLDHSQEQFDLGLHVVARFTDGPTYLCVREKSTIGARTSAPVTVEEFAGPHPAGTAGFHVHRLRPVSRRHSVWTIGYQDIVATGRLFQTGRLDVSRIVAIAGPPVRNARLIRTRLGASVADLTAGEDQSDAVRWISGSILSGKAARGVHGYLGRFDVQLSALYEDRTRELLGWCMPGRTKYSVLPVFLSRLFGDSDVEFSTSTHGSPRAMVPIGNYERVMPMDIMPTFLLRSLMVGDLERAEELGVLELCEEDLALCTFVCPGKTDYAPALRRVLDRIEAQW